MTQAPAQTASDLWETIAGEAAAESALWAAALRPEEAWERLPIFSALAENRFRLALETIYEGYLLHYGRPRLFAPGDPDTGVLLGDYLFAHGLVRLAASGGVHAVSDLAELISVSTQLRAERADPWLDGLAWAATAACLGGDTAPLERARTSLRLDRDPRGLRALALERAGEDALGLALDAHGDRVQ